MPSVPPADLTGHRLARAGRGASDTLVILGAILGAIAAVAALAITTFGAV